ncbi:MAG TPA: DUF998 domain-containing protein [Chthonomonadaceae bacterium]|nr:DUF998 domain-containing protein [Chthonomonadaceae bacterium]
MAGAARLTLAGTLFFLAVVLTLHFLRRDYDLTRRFLSEFAVGPYGALMTTAFSVLGLSACALASLVLLWLLLLAARLRVVAKTAWR